MHVDFSFHVRLVHPNSVEAPSMDRLGKRWNDYNGRLTQSSARERLLHHSDTYPLGAIGTEASFSQRHYNYYRNFSRSVFHFLLKFNPRHDNSRSKITSTGEASNPLCKLTSYELSDGLRVPSYPQSIGLLERGIHE